MDANEAEWLNLIKPSVLALYGVSRNNNESRLYIGLLISETKCTLIVKKINRPTILSCLFAVGN
jgi:hypothetical protein